MKNIEETISILSNESQINAKPPNISLRLRADLLPKPSTNGSNNNYN